MTHDASERERLLTEALALLDTSADWPTTPDSLGDLCHARNLLAGVRAWIANPRNGRCACGRVLETRMCGTCRACLVAEERRG